MVKDLTILISMTTAVLGVILFCLMIDVALYHYIADLIVSSMGEATKDYDIFDCLTLALIGAAVIACNLYLITVIACVFDAMRDFYYDHIKTGD